MAKLPLKTKKITKHSEEAHLELLWNFPLKTSGREALGQFGTKNWAAVRYRTMGTGEGVTTKTQPCVATLGPRRTDRMGCLWQRSPVSVLFCLDARGQPSWKTIGHLGLGLNRWLVGAQTSCSVLMPSLLLFGGWRGSRLSRKDD